MAFSYVTMKSKAMQQFTEHAGFEPERLCLCILKVFGLPQGRAHLHPPTNWYLYAKT